MFLSCRASRLSEAVAHSCNPLAERGEIVLGYRESSVPFSFVEGKHPDGSPRAIGYAIDLCGEIADDIQAVAGMRIQIVGFESLGEAGWGVVEDICRRWLRLDVLTEEQSGHVVPDVVLWLDDTLQSSTVSAEQASNAPNIVICKDPFVAYQRFRMHESTGQEGVFEYITQP